MPAPVIDVLAADLGLIAYEPGFLLNPIETAKTELARFDREFHSLISGVDWKIGPVPFGFISFGAGGPVCTIRGTQVPQGSLIEWLDDFDAVLESCPFLPGARWHRGFGRVYSTLNCYGTLLAAVLRQIPGIVIEGHSLGGPLATYAAIETGPRPPVLFASPKPGDSALRDRAIAGWTRLPNSYANPNDAVPKVPITVDWPFKIEDFQHVAEPLELSASSVTPTIPGNWADSHALGNYRRLLGAIA